MAPRKYKPRKKRKWYHRKKKYQISKSLVPKTYYFNRCVAKVFELNDSPTGVPTGWHRDADEGYGIWRTQEFKLSDIASRNDFTGLFKQYKIVAVSQKFWFQSTDTRMTSGNVGNQLQIYLRYNRTGQAASIVNPLTENVFLNTQAKRVKPCYVGSAKPIQVYQKVRQLGMVYHSTVDTDYTLMKPRFISTAEDDTPHYGMDMRIQRLDNNEFSHGGSVFPSVKVQTTYYITCRQVE